jgi:hypothetical protein
MCGLSWLQDPGGGREQTEQKSRAKNPDCHKASTSCEQLQQLPMLVGSCVAQAVEAGGTDNGAPGHRAHYGPGGVGCFVVDLDDNNIEVAFRP